MRKERGVVGRGTENFECQAAVHCKSVKKCDMAWDLVKLKSALQGSHRGLSEKFEADFFTGWIFQVSVHLSWASSVKATV